MSEKKQPAAADDFIPADVAAMSFEEAMAALEEIVRKLESGQVGLEESIAMYTRGTQLKQHCEVKLQSAKEQVEKIVVGPGGDAVASETIDPD